MILKPLMTALVLTSAMTLAALAKTVTFKTDMANYGGRGAYLAIYVTDGSGAYAGTIAMAGGRSRYYRHLGDWARLTGGGNLDVSAITGASVGSGGSMTVTADLADSLFDAGYTLHIDAAVEEMRDSPNEIAVPLTAAGNGQAAVGSTYIANFSYSF